MQVEQIINQDKTQKTPRKSRAKVSAETPKVPKGPKVPKDPKEPKKNEETKCLEEIVQHEKRIEAEIKQMIAENQLNPSVDGDILSHINNYNG